MKRTAGRAAAIGLLALFGCVGGPAAPAARPSPREAQRPATVRTPGAPARPGASASPPAHAAIAPGPAMAANQVATLAGGQPAGFAEGTGLAARFDQPSGLALDSRGHLFIADAQNQRIRELAPDGSVTTFAGSGVAGAADGAGRAASFSHPMGLAFDPAGRLIVADEANHRIRAITPDGRVSTLAGSGSRGFADGPAASARFAFPTDVAVDARGTVYVADYANQRVRAIAPDGQVSTVAGNGSEGQSDGVATSATLRGPFGVAAGAAGTLWIADRGNRRLRKLSGGMLTTPALSLAPASDSELGRAPLGDLAALAVAPDGGIYTSEALAGLIRHVAPDGRVTLLAGAGVSGSLDGPGDRARFNGPLALVANGPHGLYVADTFNALIRTLRLP